jgi:hypothetical protein
MHVIKIQIPKKTIGKIRSGIKVGSIIKSKKAKRESWRKRKHKKGNHLIDSLSSFIIV